MSKSKKKKVAAKRKKSKKKSSSLHSLQMDTNSSPISKLDIADNVTEIEACLCPYDENLLERSRTQWQFGDWQSLAEIR